ncbi:4a-hydroxytetrahydrobiopterin dehydratase [Modestobacter sp. Leaf380]|nr:4a-hydroxytetrahydrobiopterin dehydratase [Modestobacter sp. Leaf380]
MPLTRTEASRAVEAIGWRLLLAELCTSVPVDSLAQGARLAAAVTDVLGADADGHLRVDLRPGRVELGLQTRSGGVVTARDVELAHRVTEVLDRPVRPGGAHPVQALEIAVDALDIPAVLPFWAAVLGLVPQPGDDEALVDPAGVLPTVWFQQMDAPRDQRNRIHLDVTVPHDEADARVAAALAAGGRLLSDADARSFWVLADAEGNEICVCTWEDRDEQDQGEQDRDDLQVSPGG